jgi:long-chain fatty acid adenylase/transferase FadD26
MPHQDADISIPALLRQRSETAADAAAYTFMDGALDDTGCVESLTWSQVYRRALAVAEELLRFGSTGDRAAILAPQGLDYIVAFLGALQAGFVAVPLSVPQFGVHDLRIASALADSAPVVLLTTSSAVADVDKYASAQRGRPAPAVIEVDLLDSDSTRELDATDHSRPGPAYLQYTSGSTRTPAGVIVSHHNVTANLGQAVRDYFDDDGETPDGTVIVSWLPFYHDMGLIMGVCAPVVTGRCAVLMSPLAFLRKPASWVQLLASHPHSVSAAPNFAFDLAVRRTSDADLAGLDLGGVQAILSGAERVHSATIKRFTERFAPFGLQERVIRPSYGLAEATLYVATPAPGRAVTTARFELGQLSAGLARPCVSGRGGSTELVSYGAPRACLIRIVDPETGTEQSEGAIGEIWVHGDNVAQGYWRKPELSARTFGARIAHPSAGTPAGPWLRTGDLGVMSAGELYIMGRLKDLLIVDGRNHYPDDIESTIQEITGGRVAAIAVEDDDTENLVAIIELKQRGSGDTDAQLLDNVKHEVSSAIWRSHSLRVGDLVLVSPGSIPITTSGKIRRSSCGELYRQGEFHRLDIAV